MKKTRIFLGTLEIAGYFTNLKTAFHFLKNIFSAKSDFQRNTFAFSMVNQMTWLQNAKKQIVS
jgi:hypothetical protein